MIKPSCLGSAIMIGNYAPNGLGSTILIENPASIALDGLGSTIPTENYALIAQDIVPTDQGISFQLIEIDTKLVGTKGTKALSQAYRDISHQGFDQGDRDNKAHQGRGDIR
ncbi:hypothetical protein TanjilG_01396 [Lupinus angustifolius]|nr:hypothetical protein TanjilG_01396 [Lupinus angustifolius]